jgi:ubiquinone/menaquinone biosynthesis C-methylase UbiE
VNEIRICFIGLSKLVTKDNSFMFYRISVNFRNFSEIYDYLLEFK